MNTHLILSRYKEKSSSNCLLDYAEKSIKKSNLKIFVYDKFEKREDTYEVVPNLGREHYGWFKHILSTWESPPDFYMFLHPCSPQERNDKFEVFKKLCMNFDNMLLSGESYYSIIEKNDFTWNKKTNSFSIKNGWLGSTSTNTEDVRKQAYKVTTYPNISAWWTSTFNLPLPAQRCTFGSTIASYKNIQSWGKDLFEKLFSEVSGYQNGELSHFLERSMLALSQGKEAYIKQNN